MNAGEIRKHIRNKRRALTSAQQQSAAKNLASLISQQSFFQRAKRIGIYLANDGEIDPLRDPYLILRDAAGKALLWSDDSRNSLDSEIYFTVTSETLSPSKIISDIFLRFNKVFALYSVKDISYLVPVGYSLS